MTPTASLDRRLEADGGIGMVYLYMIVLVAAVGGFLFGYDLSLISGAIIFLRREFNLDPIQVGNVVGSAILGCPFGPLVGVWLADNLGRKRTLILALSCFWYRPLVVRWLVACSNCVSGGSWAGWAWACFDGVADVHCGGRPRLRGRLVVVNQLAVVIGLSLSVFVTWLLSGGGHWRWMFATQGVPVACLIAGLLVVPESPRWLATMGKWNDALRTLVKINGSPQAEAEIKAIREEVGEESGGFRELLQPGVRFALLIGILVMVFSQINGVNIILIYAPTLSRKLELPATPTPSSTASSSAAGLRFAQWPPSGSRTHSLVALS